jgi:energy-coupling factor transporter ATP-binding protein EcfA2
LGTPQAGLTSPILEGQEVTYRYPQNNRGLAPVSLSLQRGELLLITGASGCGKSTLARCLTGLIPHLYRGKLSGSVWLHGLPTAQTPLWQLAERAGLVFQNPATQMLAETVEGEIIFGLENLGLLPRRIGQRLSAVLKQFGLQALRDRPPQTLSGGEQQKLALASIMARQPPVLVLDEPLSMLDATAALELVAHVTALAQEQATTIVVCEHREEYFDWIPGLRRYRLGDGHPPPAWAPAPRGKNGSWAWAPPPLADADSPCLEVKGLTVKLGGQTILRNLGFRARGGEVVAIVGRNGVGKTTLLRSLAGLQKHEGNITLSGDRPDLGLVFQNADLQLFNASVREEILYRVPNPDLELYRWLLEALGLASYEEAPPLLLSEGEKKRVALATVLMRRPKHGLLLDEPSLGQDGAHKEQLMRVARALAAAGRLVILTTHDLPLAAGADRLALLGPAGFVADGPPADVLEDHGAWASLGLSVPDWLVRPGQHEATRP